MLSDEDGNGSFTLDPTLYYYDVFLIDWDGDKGCDQEIAIKIESNVGFDFSNTPVSIKATDVNNKETVLFTCTDPVFASSVYNGLVDFYSDSILYITGDVTINEEDNDSGIYIPPMGVLHTENSKITVGDTSYFAFHPESTWIVGSNTSVDLKGEFCPPLGVEADYKKLNCDIKASGPNASIRILNGDLPILLGSAIIEDTADNYIRMSEDGEATLNLADLSLSLNKGIFTSENFPAVLPALNPNYNPEIPEESEENPEEPEENPIIEAPLTINVKADAILDVPADNMIFTVNIANIHGELKVAEGGTFEGPATVYGKAYIQGDIADATFTLSGKDAVILSDTKITLTNPDADVVELTGDKLTVDGHTYQFGKMLKATSDDSGSGSGSGGTSSPSTKPVTKPTTPTEPTKPTEPTAPATVGAFKDVPTTSYYAEAVQWAVDKGVTNGTSDTTFAPTEVCTRAQALNCLWRAVGSPEPDMTNNPFGDVAESDYYYKAVLWAIQNGITKGVSDSAFDPNAECRRAQCLTFLYRTFDALGDGSASVFSDVDDDSYYFGAVSWAFSSGVTNGTSATTFSPDDPCVRADMVSFLYRAFAK